MRAYVVHNWLNSVDELKIQEVEIPQPKAGEVLVKVLASGVNFFDILQVQGKYQHKPPFPFIPGAECAGVVVKVGPGKLYKLSNKKVTTMSNRKCRFIQMCQS
jgi:NADPH2:quinone reductase